eukprot:3099907-Pleurochrysis_carterae.AAC.1
MRVVFRHLGAFAHSSKPSWIQFKYRTSILATLIKPHSPVPATLPSPVAHAPLREHGVSEVAMR